jgi:hypothetical protein
MTGSIVKVIFGLFIWMVLPSLVKKNIKNKSLFKFVSISCMLLGGLVIIFGVVELLKDILNVEF